MSKKIFFCFDYESDMDRALVVRDGWAAQGKSAAGFIDQAAYEQIKREGLSNVCNWMDQQIEDSAVSVVLIGSETLSLPYIQHAVLKSVEKGMPIIGVHVEQLKDNNSVPSARGETHTIIGKYPSGTPAYFDDIADGIYNYRSETGSQDLVQWIEDTGIVLLDTGEVLSYPM